ncbi:OsmC/Ohr family protein [Lunatimonas lonarensis]|uniref:OsmC/Ohr family protein n=1 Tax=Lunatimonas lonarensis TaxID=1232681 RepID=R7ZX36_9BACT|nr:OsmC family protein [Lunatimonas lonarensis]EON78622.1 OsmC/Ohr family protein [Lunatimonas lonarensis]
MAKRNITLKMISEHEYESVNATGNKVQIDMHEPSLKRHQAPMELLLSALAGCSAVDAVSMMKKRRKEVVDLVVDAEGDRDEGIPAFYKSIHLKFILTSPDATLEEFEKVVKLAVEKYCSVASSLKSSVTHSCEIVRPS